MLEIKNVTYAYSKIKDPVLKDYSLNVKPGTICGLLGENGAGKSTLFYLISGLLKPQTGSISFNGMDPWRRDPQFLREIYILPEEFKLPDVTLKEFIKTTAPFYPSFSAESLEQHLDTFEMDTDLHLGSLSMGQKKRVAISFALSSNTPLLLLDEPTNGLDIPGKRLFRKALLNGMNDNRTVIISTHQVFDVEKILDHIVITDRKGVLLDDSVAGICSRWSFPYTQDRHRAEKALFALDAPGGFNLVENASESEETDINLESLFEFIRTAKRL